MIELQEVTKRFGDLIAVDRLSLRIEPGEIFGLLGPNGAGKTTTLKLLCGLLQPTNGHIRIGGMDIVQEPRKVKQILGVVPDQPMVYPKLTGIEFLEFIGGLYSVPKETQREKIPEWLAAFELSDRGESLVETYSHGMRQKLVLASLLMRSPRVLLLDEPLVGLDPKSIRLMREILLAQAQAGVTIFLCTHILEIAERLCQRVGILQRGRLTAIGTLAELRAMAKEGGTLEDIFLELTAPPSPSPLPQGERNELELPLPSVGED